jgi:molybdenum cofactor cytidylyltransferase
VRFGPTALAEAEGAILAHTLRLREGRVLRKGRRLTAADVAALAAAGHAEVVAARLEPGDVAEDEAAAALARAACGPGVRAASPFTGRCNLHATARGVLVVDRARVDRANAVDEGLTLATLAPWSLVAEGELVATVKVIPFAVPQRALDACAAAASEGDPLLRVAAFAPLAAGLILTRTPGLPAAVIERAAESQRVRLARLGGRVLQEIRCPHDEAQVAESIASLVAAGCSPILILGATAIADRRDVIPAAVVRAGGAVEHLGMPVDPGNLLLLARCGGTPVVGLPGCARSLQPSGFDWVLERLAAGLSLSSRDLMSMGAGGLLSEAARPQPRERAADADDARAPNVGAVVLAAGLSRRMGGPNKLVAEVEGAPMVARVADAVLATTARPVVVVTGHDAPRVRAALAGREVIFAHNPDYRAGLASSLKAGVAALGDKVDGALVCLGDMPWVRPEHVEALLAAFADDTAAICVPVHERKRGHPVLWPARYFGEIARLEGDVGARALLDEHADRVRLVPVADPGVALDVDTPDALAGR